MTVSQTMRAASPPASGAEIVESGRRRRGMLGRMAKQNSLDDMGLDLGKNLDNKTPSTSDCLIKAGTVSARHAVTDGEAELPGRYWPRPWFVL